MAVAVVAAAPVMATAWWRLAAALAAASQQVCMGGILAPVYTTLCAVHLMHACLCMLVRLRNLHLTSCRCTCAAAGPPPPQFSLPSQVDACGGAYEQQRQQLPSLDAATQQQLSQQAATIAATDPAQPSPPVFTTQANCTCSPYQWTPPHVLGAGLPGAVGGSQQYIGCAAASIGNDTQNAPWCPVDPTTCEGYYGSWALQQAKPLFQVAVLSSTGGNASGGAQGAAVTGFAYDFCAPVRTVTQSGCLCQGAWWARVLLPVAGSSGGSGQSDDANRQYFEGGVCADPAVHTAIDHMG